MAGHDIAKEKLKFKIVFGALMFLTVVTVAISYLDVTPVVAIILALIVASIKASLVVSFFMHLLSEKPLIYSTLIFTVIFFVGVLVLPYLQSIDPITETDHYKSSQMAGVHSDHSKKHGDVHDEPSHDEHHGGHH